MHREEIELERLACAPLTRRRLLSSAGGLAALATLSALPGDLAWARSARLDGNPFTLGVAAGDPLPHGAVLWTRLAPQPPEPSGGMAEERVRVRWEVAADEDMRQLVRSGEVAATPALGHSVHVEVAGLRPQREYFYRFRVGDAESVVGRTLTAPPRGASLDHMRFAFASCQEWEDGFYAAYRQMLDEELDAVVHLGDYIYENAIPANGGNRKLAAPLPAILQHETQTLEDYRVRHALYKTDADLQAAHARFPWIVTWDDHEVDNDYADEAPIRGMPSPKFVARRAAAYQAFYEHMPLSRHSLPRGADMRLYRRLDFGDLARFNVLDTRQYRDDQPCGDGEFAPCPGQATTSIIGSRQEAWLRRGLETSGAQWNVLAQQVMMAQLDHKLGEGQVFWSDAWDGYQGQRQRLLDLMAERRVANPVVITGDWHSTFVNDLKANFNDPASPTVATEFVGTSITTNGDAIVYGPYYGPMVPENPHIRFFEGDRRGYVVCSLDRALWQTELRMVTTVSRPDAPAYTLAALVVEDGRPGAQPVS